MADTTLQLRGALAGSGGSSPESEDERVRLADLHTCLVDTVMGYEKVVEKAEPDFVGIAEEFHMLHQSQAERVAAMLTDLGHDTKDEGSLFGMVNRAVVEIRSWFDEIGHNVMDALVQGERNVLEAFDYAIVASPNPERLAILDQMRVELVRLLQRHAPGMV
jgi:hypothetical protein